MSTPSKPALNTPTSHGSRAKAPKTSTPDTTQASAALALDMGWKLLVIVLLPLLVGRYMDRHSGNGMFFTVISLVVGLVGMTVIVVQTVRQLNVINGANTEDDV